VIETVQTVLELLKLLGLCRYNSIHSKAQDLSEADVIINHFAELNFEKLHLFNPN
jgi:hypothetical protein